MNPKQFATEVTQTLQQAGHTALWAGGCVRDALLGRAPKDYDVATSATPDEVRALFGFKKTLSVGASFGVITVIGPKSAGHIEVATFRRDGGYSDGRRPDSVEFTDAREDAIRRDFTINGMFFDPVIQQVIDYVGGQDDLEARQIRAIGDPEKRIEEDKLRMLRGVRFASTFDFKIDPDTLSAIVRRAPEIDVVSPERIGNEIVRMLSDTHFNVAVELLEQTGLWQQVLPAGSTIALDHAARLNISDENEFPFESVIAVLLSNDLTKNGSQRYIDRLQDGWRLTNDQAAAIAWLCDHVSTLEQAEQLPWSQVQPVVASKYIAAGLDVAAALGANEAAISYCRFKLELPRNQLDPPPLLVGKDLIEMGLQPGPTFKEILATIRQKQLDDEIVTVDQARKIAADFNRKF